MPRCSFCKHNYEFPIGLSLILNDGNIMYFCSGKCRKNFKLGRDNKKVNWIRKDKSNKEESFEIKEQEASNKVAEKKREEKIEKKS